jgi:Mrp family chromosome partitioning ATPase
MGEITEALRRAREQQRAGDPVAPGAGPESLRAATPPVAPRETVEISLERDAAWPARAVVIDARGHLAEAMRHLALKLRHELERRRVRSVAVTSPLRGEGKTTLACDLALALASVTRGRSVALADFDLRSPSIATNLGLRPAVGVEAFLRGQARLEDVCVSIEKPALDVYPARVPEDAAHELLVQPSMGILAREFERRYTTVVYDTPPTLLVPDVRILLQHVPAYLAVSRFGVTRQRSVKAMLELLPREPFLGGVLNGGPLPSHASHYGYYGVAPEEQEA